MFDLYPLCSIFYFVFLQDIVLNFSIILTNLKNMKKLLLPLTLLFCSTISSCEKLTDTFQIIKTDNSILNGFEIKEYLFQKISNDKFVVKLTCNSIDGAIVSFEADHVNKKQIHKYKDDKDEFEITFANEIGVLYIHDEKALLDYEIFFDQSTNGFIDRKTGKKIEGNDWISYFKINKMKYIVLSSIIDDILNKKRLFIDPIKVKLKEKMEKELALKEKAYSNRLKNGYADNVMIPDGCANGTNCQSRTFYNFDRSSCCSEAHTDLTICCSNRSCFDCCTYNSCNFGGIFGDFLGICTESGKSCSTNGS
jgi:hypothetical protein